VFHGRFSVTRLGATTDSTGVMADPNENPYLRDAVMTATPEQLQLMLYDGCIRYATQAREAIERKDYETSYDKLTRAQHIILEMQNGLNYEVNRGLCERVASIYNFLYRKLVDASVRRDVDAIDDALRVLRIERETWQILVDKVNKVRAPDSAEDKQSPDPAEEAHSGFSAAG
jgi:flagellar protein FliS